jgi:hypothetical protein
MQTLPRFFSVSDNSIHKRGFPWIRTVRKGLSEVIWCNTCDRAIQEPEGDLEVVLEQDKGTRWPDVLGCGHWPLLILSAKVLSAWKSEGLEELPRRKVTFLDPLPKALAATTPPKHHWIDGAKLRGALLDFDASGFVGVKFCPECDTRSDNIPATYQRQHSQVCPYVFRAGTWSGRNLFTTDISTAAFFCTDALVKLAAKNKFSNFRFIPVEEGHRADSKGLEYI